MRGLQHALLRVARRPTEFREPYVVREDVAPLLAGLDPL